MCGIVGFIEHGRQRHEMTMSLGRMVDTISHRGPDGAGHFVDARRGLALGHRRLAIRDLSPTGHQPMWSPSGRHAIVYNGEIYNTAELRARIAPGVGFRGSSDTEVLLAAFEHLGIDRTLEAVAGMFAIALYSVEDNSVTLIRDRLGIKPVYYSVQGDTAIWGSELKALVAHPALDVDVDAESLALFLRFGYVPAPRSILARVFKQLPGTYLTFDLDRPGHFTTTVYWSAADAADRSRRFPHPATEAELVESFEELLGHVIRQHTISDVPVGGFLSGGIDSSSVLALMQSEASRPVRSFSIGFHDSTFDEAPAAREVAAHLGTDHTEYYLSLAEAADIVPSLPELYCEPFSDTSAIPTLCLARRARQSVAVALTGDGGDELLAGYPRYVSVPRIHQRIRMWPVGARRLLASVLSLPPQTIYRHLDPLKHVVARRPIAESLAECVRKTQSLLSTRSPRDLYECVSSVSFGANRTGVLSVAAAEDVACPLSRDVWSEHRDLLSNMQLWDTVLYLPNDILHKVDMASMAVGLEARVPLLDHRVFEWIWRAPPGLRRDHDRGKRLLRQVLYRHVPQRLVDRGKRGFSAPLSAWLRTGLRDWAESLLDDTNVRRSGLLNPHTVARYRNEFFRGQTGHARLWPILVFLSWYQQHIRNGRPNDEHRLRNPCRHPVSVGGQH